MHKVTLLLGFGAGYVLGAKAGRGRYDELVDRFETLKANPKTQEVAGKVQEKASVAAESAKNVASDKLHEAKDKVAEAVSRDETGEVKSSSGDSPDFDPLAGPKGDLP